jgi:phospholipase C
VLIFNFDEWGGFYDHIKPAAAPIPAADAAAGNQDGLRGFRVPCLMVSPYAKRSHVATRTYDHTSILAMIERRWGLEPLTVRDAAANDLAAELTVKADRRAPDYTVPRGPFGGPCTVQPPGGAESPEEEWGGLRDLALKSGYTLPAV